MKDLVEQNKILEVQVGSQVYGTSTPDSDTDYMGIFIASKRFYLGLDKVEEVDLSTVSKLANGKNDKDAVDLKYYELRKYVKLAMDNNPNILDALFSPRDKIVYINDFGEMLLGARHLFPYKGLAQKYLGYAFSQKHKMCIKVNNFDTLHQFNSWLDENLVEPNHHIVKGNKYLSNQLLAELRTVKIPGIKFHEHQASCGDINISLTEKLSKVRAKVKDRLSKVGNREELYTKYGFDTKFGSHLIRLLLEGKELLQTGQLEYPLKDREMLLDIRNGKWTKEDIIKYSEDLEHEFESLVENSKLPSKPRYNEIEHLLISMVEEHWRK